MVTRPVRIHVKPYKGKDPRKLSSYREALNTAGIIAKYLNGLELQPGETRIVSYHEIADALGLSVSTVHDLVYAVDGGDGGITIRDA